MFFLLLMFLSLLFALHYIINYKEKASLLRKIPGFNEMFIIGAALDIIVSPVELFKLARKFAKEHDGIYSFWSLFIGVVNIYNPKDIEVILSSMKYHEKSAVYRFLKPWLHDGLLLSSGTKWQDRRKILTPAFHFNILRQYFVSIESNTKQVVEGLHNILEKEVNIALIMSEYTLNTICETAMGTRLSEESLGKSYKISIYKLGYFLIQRFTKLYLFLDCIFNLSPLAKEQKKYLTVVHNFTEKIIDERKKYIIKYGIKINDSSEISTNNENTLKYGKKNKMAMLDLLILAEKDGLIDCSGVQEEVDTFMFEGHDTTASGLTYCLMLLANHKEEQDKVVAELQDILGEEMRPVTVEDLSAMRYLENCIKESMRLYPPVPFISRQLNDVVELSNYKVPAGTLCHIHIYDLHRREDLFPSALKFNPDRFLPENSIGRHPYAYIPFSAGPRNCIGQKFAMMEMKSIITGILRNFELVPITGCADLLFQSDLVLRNSGPVYMKFKKRENAF